MRALRCHDPHNRRATIPGRQNISNRRRLSQNATTRRAGMRALRCYEPHNRRATIPGRQNIAYGKRPSQSATTRRAGMRALRCHDPHNRRATIPGRQNISNRKRPSQNANTWRAGMRALRCYGAHGGVDECFLRPTYSTHHKSKTGSDPRTRRRCVRRLARICSLWSMERGTLQARVSKGDPRCR